MKVIDDIQEITDEFTSTNPIIVVQDDNFGYLTATCSPTGNCQFFSIAYIDTLFRYFPLREEDTKIIDVLKKFMKKIEKRMMLIDVHLPYKSRVHRLFGADIVVETEYTSTNGNTLILYLIKTDKLK